MAVNNCAAAVLLAAAALAGPGREIVVSRGQLVEIGGGFRIPEVVAQAGARLVEVGTTNRTRRADYERAIGPATGAILRAHPSNFRQLGFVQEVEIEELCELGAPVIDDVGSGNLAEDLPALADEPPVRRSVKAGAALVCFSGDKLLGGPQAGVLVGRAEAIAAARAHPLARALRLDKLSLAALEATLALYREPERARAEIPVLAMLTADEADAGRPRPPARRGHRRARRDRRSERQGRRRRAAAARAARPGRRGRRAARGARRPPARRGSARRRADPGRPPPPRPAHAGRGGDRRGRRRRARNARPARLTRSARSCLIAAVPKYDAFGREIGEDTLGGLGSGASADAAPVSEVSEEAAGSAAARPRSRRGFARAEPAARRAAGVHAAASVPAAAALSASEHHHPAAPAAAPPERPRGDARGAVHPLHLHRAAGGRRDRDLQHRRRRHGGGARGDRGQSQGRARQRRPSPRWRPRASPAARWCARPTSPRRWRSCAAQSCA